MKLTFIPEKFVQHASTPKDRSRLRRKPWAALLVVMLALQLIVPSITVAESAQGFGRSDNTARGTSSKSSKSDKYIVRLAENPVVAYTGGIPGYKATKPNKGQKIDPNDPQVINYASYLTSRHDVMLNGVGGGKKLYSYLYSFNGFAAQLTAAQANKLAATAGVISVTPDELQHLDTSRTPTFLGLDAPGGLWEQLGGNPSAGENIVVGVVDSGIWPENPSFSDRTGIGPNDQEGKLGYQQIPGWHGKCIPGEAFPASSCNQKVISAQWFNQGFGGNAQIKASFPYEYISARDADGHGSHTASTAAGNYGVEAIVDGINLGKISGMAPRARIAPYKVCWGGDEGGCFNSDSVAAIDQAVADGVDVINFSISGSLTSFLDPVEVAFLFAADAGVFVAASAGNSGPTASTVAHNSPWLTTVAAGSHDRVYQATVTLGNGATYSGISLGSGTPSLPVILSSNAGKAGANPAQVTLCFVDTLDPAKVAGKIVVCNRGVNARTDKSLAVKQAGGAGMILANTSPNSLNADLHSVPTVHVDEIAGAAIKAYVSSTPGATAQLSPGTQVAGAEAPFVASFSSRGPALAGSGDLLKPDIMAPGVDILAAISPAGDNGRNWDFLSGTSMSSPHMAGIGALMKQKYPNWSPAAIKSAFMTSASQKTNKGNPILNSPLAPFAYGAGQVVPNSAADPGLVYDSGWNDWLAFLCGTGQLTASYCSAIAIDPSDLNYPSIAIGALAGVQTVKRTVTNVGKTTATYTPTVSVPGLNITVSPGSITVAPGQKASYTLTISTGTATLNAYTSGAITWSDGAHSVRSPIVVRPVALAAPGQVSGNGSPINYNVTFGYNGSFTTSTRGLIPATTVSDTVQDDPGNSFSPGGPGTKAFTVVIPAGTSYARFSLFDNFTDGNDDLDLYVYRGTTLVGSSGTGTSNEEVNLVNPVAATYTVYVHGWQTDGPDANFTLFSWLLGTASAGNMTVSAPANAVLGSNGTISLSFSSLAPATKYLGSVVYSGTSGMPNPTIVRVDTP